jgi:macrolide transport system ATP-binding/permease protein
LSKKPSKPRPPGFIFQKYGFQLWTFAKMSSCPRFMPAAPAERKVVSLAVPDLENARTIAGVAKVTPELDDVVLARHRDRDFLVTATGTDENFPMVRDWPIVEGSFFSGAHLRQHAPVIVLGATARENLFPGGIDAVGQYMLIGKSPFLVLGVWSARA